MRREYGKRHVVRTRGLKEKIGERRVVLRSDLWTQAKSYLS